MVIPKPETDIQFKIRLNMLQAKLRYERALNTMVLKQGGRTLPCPHTRAELRRWRDKWLQQFDEEWKRWA